MPVLLQKFHLHFECPPPTTNCGPGDIELVEDVEEKGKDAKIPTQQITIFDWKISL